MNYYNEFDEKAAAWIQELIYAGHIPYGYVDTRSIEDVRPSDLAGFTQCHFFAGIGVWAYALRRAGWDDGRAVWTASCPCQPFSAAGQGAGFDDERHLWPHLHHLIRVCRPPVVFGEQVASKDGLGWLDLVSTDLEGESYAVAAADLCAAGVGAPHIRQRLYWVADADSGGFEGPAGLPRGRDTQTGTAGDRGAGGLADTERLAGGSEAQPAYYFGAEADGPADRVGGRGGASGGLADADGWHASTERQQRGGEQRQQPEDGRTLHGGRPGPTNGHWHAADWLQCRDAKWRPVEPGTFPLAHGAPARVGRLRGYGNAIVAPLAQAFIEAYMSHD